MVSVIDMAVLAELSRGLIPEKTTPFLRAELISVRKGKRWNHPTAPLPGPLPFGRGEGESVASSQANLGSGGLDKRDWSRTGYAWCASPGLKCVQANARGLFQIQGGLQAVRGLGWRSGQQAGEGHEVQG